METLLFQPQTSASEEARSGPDSKPKKSWTVTLVVSEEANQIMVVKVVATGEYLGKKVTVEKSSEKKYDLTIKNLAELLPKISSALDKEIIKKVEQQITSEISKGEGEKEEKEEENQKGGENDD